MERALIALLALALNALAMGPWLTRPLAAALHYPAATIRGIERKLNRPQRALTVRRQRGLLLLVAVWMCALAAGFALERLHSRWLELLLLAALLPVRPTWDLAAAMARALQAGDVAQARLCLHDSVWRHYALLDDHALARAAIEILAVHFSEKIIAPIFWYLLLGMPGLLLAKSLYLLDENLCQPLSPTSGFSRPVAILHFITSFIPSRLAALLWLPTLFFLPGAASSATAMQLFAGIGDRLAPEQVAVHAAASVLGLSLGGPTSVYTESQWQGSGSAKAGPDDVRRGVYLWVLLQIFAVVLLGLLAK